MIRLELSKGNKTMLELVGKYVYILPVFKTPSSVPGISVLPSCQCYIHIDVILVSCQVSRMHICKIVSKYGTNRWHILKK